ncbi:hypothetical protein GO013_07375 [Pseudodesulfovibrio sp. JC047]|uniref:hypothetical protein n=1 Tax=Pseudodesulfovibrio sp. JC047 TaxID=2683199 RepID=UPI0013D79052|nr:hypothetical protein [Pseudodesulfovibrio sp. JC047]NDV19239.1 hypothetical protein [Pseudodesulfovibrio sp. JC047]
MCKKTIPVHPHEWQRDANDLLGANLVGDVCGKKSKGQAYRWARVPGVEEAQHGPLKHVMMVCDKLVDEGSPAARDAAVDAARILVTHLAGQGVPIRLARDVPDLVDMSASLASQALSRAVSDVVQAAIENKPPALIHAHLEHVVQQALAFGVRYQAEYTEFGSGRVRFKCGGPVCSADDVVGRVVDRKKRRGVWAEFLRTFRKKVRG